MDGERERESRGDFFFGMGLYSTSCGTRSGRLTLGLCGWISSRGGQIVTWKFFIFSREYKATNLRSVTLGVDPSRPA